MKLRSCLCLVCLLLLCAGCYRATVVTGLPPSNETISKPFASCWIYGLVPPSAVDAVTQCPHGVAMVQTRLSFANYVIGVITLGIYTPMSITVTCASPQKIGSAEDRGHTLVAGGPSRDEIMSAVARAAELSLVTGHAVYVRLP